MTDTMCYRSIHEVPVHSLVEDNRILLKDLRVLTVVRVQPAPETGKVVLKHFNLASGDRGEMTLPVAQPVKLLCEGRCFISRELDNLL